MGYDMLLKTTSAEKSYMGFNSNGHGIAINANGEGISPMENLLLSVAACSCVDVESILAKMRNELAHLQVEITAERVEDQTPKPFKSIHLHYVLYGEVKESSAEKAISMAVEKYCSVSACLDPGIVITHDFEIREE